MRELEHRQYMKESSYYMCCAFAAELLLCCGFFTNVVVDVVMHRIFIFIFNLYIIKERPN